MTMRVAVRTAVMLVALVDVVLAGPLEDANEALIRKDYAKAVQLYRPLAAAGNPDAQVNLGYMFDEGLGVSRDYGEAVRWYRLAADQGQPQGLNNLANMYRDGVGVQQDYVQAHLWFNLAAGRFDTKEKRDSAAKDRDNIAAKMTAEQIVEAQRLAQTWKPKTGSSPSWLDSLKRFFR
jgi:TPR repeat protein